MVLNDITSVNLYCEYVITSWVIDKCGFNNTLIIKIDNTYVVLCYISIRYFRTCNFDYTRLIYIRVQDDRSRWLEVMRPTIYLRTEYDTFVWYGLEFDM